MFSEFLQTYKTMFTPKDTASRHQYWSFILFNFIFNLIFITVLYFVGASSIITLFTSPSNFKMSNLGIFGIPLVLFIIYGIITMIATISLYIKRLHDMNFATKTFWLIFVLMIIINIFSSKLVTLIQFIFAIVLGCIPANDDEHGPLTWDDGE